LTSMLENAILLEQVPNTHVRGFLFHRKIFLCLNPLRDFADAKSLFL